VAEKWDTHLYVLITAGVATLFFVLGMSQPQFSTSWFTHRNSCFDPYAEGLALGNFEQFKKKQFGTSL
jgi:hypothetical protein